MTSNYHERNHWVGTDAEMALCTPINPGAIWFQTNTGDSYWWDGAVWVAMGGGGPPPASCFICDGTNSYGGDNAFDSHTTADYSTVVGYNAGTVISTGRWNSVLGSEAVDSGNPSYAVAIGWQALRVSTGSGNVAVGAKALRQTSTGIYNVGVGIEALDANLGGNKNVAICMQALYRNTSGNSNIAIGSEALWANTTGSYNIAIGDAAMDAHADCYAVIAIGSNALGENKADGNVAVGHYAMSSNTTGSGNIAIGWGAMNANTIKNSNIAIGKDALHDNVDGRGNVAIGDKCMPLINERDNIGIGLGTLFTAEVTYNNIAIGSDALYNYIDGGHAAKQGSNIGIGSCALFGLVYGDYNIGIQSNFDTYYTHNDVFIGERAGDSVCNGDSNVAVGSYALASTGSGCGDENVAIGYQAMEYLDDGGDWIDAFIDYSGTVAGTVEANAPGHGFPAGTTAGVKISGTAHYDGVYTITWIDVDNFYFTHVWSGNDAAVYWMARYAMDSKAKCNTAVGVLTAMEFETGSLCTFIGYQAGEDGSQKADAVNSMALGANSYTTKDNQIVIGDDNIVETLLKGVVILNDHLLLTGNARVNNIVNLGIDLLASGAAAPGVVKTVNYYGYAYKVNDDGFVRSFEIPYDWDDTTDVIFHIHWYCNNTTAAKFIQWQLDYSAVAEDTEQVNVGTSTIPTGDIAVSTTAYRLTETSITIPVAGLARDDVIGMQIKRIAASGGGGVIPDNYPTIVSLELEYVCDRMGEI